MNYKYTTACTIFVLLWFGCRPEPRSSDATSIYGEDDRLEVFQVEQASVRSLVRSTVSLIKADNLQGSRLTGQTLGEKMELCEGERFRNQLSVAFCSGFLVRPDTIITSGHCFRDVGDCAKTKVLFDYALSSPESNPEQMEPTNLYSCQEVLVKEYGGEDKLDFAVVRLDRNVSNRTPLELDLESDVKVGDPIFTIGNPAGLPLKVAGNARVIKSDANQTFFEATLDSFGGSSGAPVFREGSQKVAGILVRGREDFNIEGSCTTSYVYKEAVESAEDVTFARRIASGLNGGVKPQPEPIPEEGQYNAFADFRTIADVSYRMANHSETLSYAEDEDVADAADELHYMVSDAYRAAQELSYLGNSPLLGDIEQFDERYWQNVSKLVAHLERRSRNAYLSSREERLLEDIRVDHDRVHSELYVR